MAAFDLLAQATLWRLAAATLQSLPLAALVGLLCRYLTRLGPGARCWLWWLVSLQLLSGLLWPHPLRVPLWPAAAPSAWVAEAPPARMMPAADENAGGLQALPALALSRESAIAADPRRESATRADAWRWPVRALMLAWLAGVAALVGRSGCEWRQTRRRLRESQAEVPAAVLARYRALAARLGLRHAPPLRLSATLDSPQLCGVWRPRLLLPAGPLSRLSDEALDMALHHELVHLRRHDLWWGWGPALAQHLFFFHPLAHLAAREYGLAREAACDAAVLSDPRHAPQDYGRLLLQFGVAPRAVAVIGAASPNFILLKRRLAMLQSRHSPWRAGAVLLVVAVAAAGVLPYRVVAADAEADAAQRANRAAQPRVPVAAASVGAVAPVAPAASTSGPEPAAQPRRALRAWTSAADADWMPAPPAPPVMPTPPAAPQAPAALSAAARPAPPAPPAAPTAPAAPLGAMRGVFSFDEPGHSERAWVLMEGDRVHAFGSHEDMREARARQGGGETLWWIREGDRRYVVRDPAIIAELKQAYAPLSGLDKQQRELGLRQGELGRQQGELGQRQGELGARLGQAAAAHAAERKASATSDASGQAQQAWSQQIRALGEQQRVLGQRQSELGAQQRVLGERQAQVLEQLRARGWQLAREAVASGKAQAL